jgi:hypothetical protein
MVMFLSMVSFTVVTNSKTNFYRQLINFSTFVGYLVVAGTVTAIPDTCIFLLTVNLHLHNRIHFAPSVMPALQYSNLQHERVEFFKHF